MQHWDTLAIIVTIIFFGYIIEQQLEGIASLLEQIRDKDNDDD